MDASAARVMALAFPDRDTESRRFDTSWCIPIRAKPPVRARTIEKSMA